MRPLYSLLTPLLVGTLVSFAAVEAKADLLSDIKGRGEIVVATEARYAPFEMIEDGKIVG